QVWSEKGTVRGVLDPVLDEYAIGFLAVHGFSSATTAYDIAQNDDGRYRWFIANHGRRCCELDAMDPNDLRACVQREIKTLMEPVAWKRCEVIAKAEQHSLRTILGRWSAP